jgi:Predicted sugar phosphatases of the HAD superfamily
MKAYGTPILALDVDGVVLDYLGGFVPWLESRGYTPTRRPHEVDAWDLSQLVGCSREEMAGLIREFAVTESFGSLSPIPGVVEAIASLRSDFQGLRIVCITSAGSSPITANLRRANLERLGLAVDDVVVLPLQASKRLCLEALPPGSVFVDDLLDHVIEAELVGLSAILFRQPYNAMDSHRLVADGWTETASLIRGLLQAAVRPCGASRSFPAI